jgi:hypothetical protein
VGDGGKGEIARGWRDGGVMTREASQSGNCR